MNTHALTLAIEAGVPVILTGDPGVGKTRIVEAIAASTGRHLEVVIASLREPADFAGLPLVHEGRVHLAAPRWAHELCQADRGLLFLDELTTASPSTQAAALRVVNEGVVGELKLPPSVSIVAAANPPEIAAGGWDLAAPLANRLVHLRAGVDPIRWGEQMLSGFSVPHTKALPEGWRSHRQKWAGLIAAFLRTRPQLLLAVPQSESGRSGPWPSPRTWDQFVCSLLAACDASGADEDTRLELVSGSIGPGPATEFLAWVNNLDLPDPEALIKKPDTFKLPSRGDQAFAVLASLVGAVVNNPTLARWQTVWKLLAAATTMGAPDIAAASAMALQRWKAENKRFDLLPPVAELRPFRALLIAAGAE